MLCFSATNTFINDMCVHIPRLMQIHPIGYDGSNTFSEEGTAYAEIYGGEGGEGFPAGGEFAHDSQEVEFMNGGDYQESQTVLVDGGDRFGVSAVTVDRKEELVWMGNSGVRRAKY